MDKIFNDYIPNNKIKLFEKYITNLDINNTLNISDILGYCISYSNIVEIINFVVSNIYTFNFVNIIY